MDPFYASILLGVGVSSPGELLQRSGTPEDRQHLARATGIPEDQIARWATQADLTRIKGVAAEYARLLEAAGIRSTPDLTRQRASNLHATMASINASRHLVQSLPSRTAVLHWIAHARTLPELLAF